MRTASGAVSIMHAAAAALLALGTAAPVQAQVQVIQVTKAISYVQTSAGGSVVGPVATPCHGCPYAFWADVIGPNIGGITPPTVSGPFNTAALGSFFNNGKLVYNAGNSQWALGVNGDDWSSPTLSNLESLYGNGTYTFIVNGSAVSLNLTGGAYPNAPYVTFSAGRWKNGVFEFDPAKPLTITTNAFTGYGGSANGLIRIGVEGGGEALQFRSALPSFNTAGLPPIVVSASNTASFTIPANTFSSGTQVRAVAEFAAMTDVSTSPGVPGSLNFASYNASVEFQLKSATPVFPMTVTTNITPTASSATANIQYRPQDVGTSGSVYTFAVAPQSLVKSAPAGEAPYVVGKSKAGEGGRKDTSVACVLAQLNAAGQLQAVSASGIQAYVTGVLSAQGQAVQVINGVPTVNIAGATFYVGYGTSSTAMLNNGINRSVVTVPGSQVCQPGPPQTGWWWNPSESGRGFSIEASGNNLFMASYLYDASGRATWYVAVGPTSLDGSVFNGQLLAFGSGVTLNGPYRGNAPLPSAGPVTLTFSDGEHGTLVWPGGTVAIQRFAFGANGTATAPLAGQPESGWWWGGSSDNGRGFFLEWQGNQAFIAGYMYDAAGNPVWYVSQGAVTNAQAYQGSWLQFANGQTLAGAYKAPTMTNGNVAPVTIQFQGADTAILGLPSGNLPIQRFRF